MGKEEKKRNDTGNEFIISEQSAGAQPLGVLQTMIQNHIGLLPAAITAEKLL